MAGGQSKAGSSSWSRPLCTDPTGVCWALDGVGTSNSLDGGFLELGTQCIVLGWPVGVIRSAQLCVIGTSLHAARGDSP